MTKKTEAPRVRLDATSISVAVRCSECVWWHGFALDKIEGWTVGARHQRRFHPGVQQAEQNLIRAKKHAAGQ